MMFCNGCKKTKIDDQFYVCNRNGIKMPTRMCRFCRDRRVGYYEKKKLFRHDGRDWTINMDLRSGRRLTLKRSAAANSTRTRTSISLPLPLPLAAETTPHHSQSLEDMSPRAMSEPPLLELPAALSATE